jgi:hypothetical protein
MPIEELSEGALIPLRRPAEQLHIARIRAHDLPVATGSPIGSLQPRILYRGSQNPAGSGQPPPSTATVIVAYPIRARATRLRWLGAVVAIGTTVPG